MTESGFLGLARDLDLLELPLATHTGLVALFRRHASHMPSGYAGVSESDDTLVSEPIDTIAQPTTAYRRERGILVFLRVFRQPNAYCQVFRCMRNPCFNAADLTDLPSAWRFQICLSCLWLRVAFRYFLYRVRRLVHTPRKPCQSPPHSADARTAPPSTNHPLPFCCRSARGAALHARAKGLFAHLCKSADVQRLGSDGVAKLLDALGLPGTDKEDIP